MFVKYASGQQLSKFIKALQELFIRSLLSPEKMAIWNLVTIIAGTFAMFQASIITAGHRLITQSHGANDSVDRLISIRGNTIFLEIFQQTILACLLLFLAPFIWGDSDQLGGLIFYCAAAVMITNALIALLTEVHEGSSLFGRLGILLPINALIQATMIFLGAYYFGLAGLAFGSIIGLSLNVLFMFASMKLMNMRWFSHLDSKMSRDLTKTGIFYRLSDLPTSIFYYSDAIIASFWLEPVSLAFYMTARILASFSTQLIVVINRMGIAELGNKIGAQLSNNRIANYLSLRFVFVYLIIIPILFAIIEPSLRWVLPELLPKYEGSLVAIPYLLLGTLTSARALLIRNYWIQKKMMRKILYSGLLGLVGMALVLIIGLIWFDDIGIFELALLTLIGQIPYSLYILFKVSSSKNSLMHMSYRLMAFILSLICIFAIFQFNGSIGQEKIGTVISLIQDIGLGLIIAAPFTFIGLKAIILIKEENIVS